MPTRTTLKRVLLVFFPLLLIIVGIMALGFWNSESLSKMQQYWKVQQVVVEGQNIIDEFKIKSLTFLDGSKMLLPVHEDSQIAAPIVYDKWTHGRVGLIQGLIEIEDKKQSIFNGVYEIEILDHRKPQLIKLASDKIEIYLRGVEGFSLENQTIRTNEIR